MNFTEEDKFRFAREGVIVRVCSENGVESDRIVRVILRFHGFSVSSVGWDGLFYARLDGGIAEMCRRHGCTALTIDGRALDEDEPRVDRALRLHAAYVVARQATHEATAGLTDAEFREFCERRER